MPRYTLEEASKHPFFRNLPPSYVAFMIEQEERDAHLTLTDKELEQLWDQHYEAELAALGLEAKKKVPRSSFPWFSLGTRPIPFQNLTQESSALRMHEMFDGCVFTQASVSGSTTVVHTMSLPLAGDHAYQMSVEHKPDKTQSYSVQYSSTGSVAASTRRMLTDRLRANIACNTSPESNTHSCELEYTGTDFVAGAKYTGIYGGIAHLSYTQSLHPQWAVGIELDGLLRMARYGLTMVVRYDRAPLSVSALYNAGTLGQLTVSSMYGPLRFTSELAVHAGQEGKIESESTFGFEYRVSNFASCKASFDSRGTVRAIMEDAVSQHTALTLCCELSYPEKMLRCGFGFSLNG